MNSYNKSKSYLKKMLNHVNQHDGYAMSVIRQEGIDFRKNLSEHDEEFLSNNYDDLRNFAKDNNPYGRDVADSKAYCWYKGFMTGVQFSDFQK